MLVGPNLFDATDGTSLLQLEGISPYDSISSVAADMDLDGFREFLVATDVGEQQIRIHEADGTLRSTCWTGHFDWAYPIFAVGNLDDDPELEFAATLEGTIVTCDTDGMLLHETSVDVAQPGILGVGQLDGDPRPEYVIGDWNGVIALDDDLTEMWSYFNGDGNPGGNGEYHPFALADLNADGVHEVIVRPGDWLVILDRSGSVIASLMGPAGCYSWNGAPAVVDVDADGLAEIVVPSWPDIAIVENPDGGWLVDGSDQPWPDIDKFPGDRTIDGAITGPAVEPWSDSRTNVWQGLPAAPMDPAAWGDLSVEIVDFCNDGSTATITAYANNHGLLATDAGIEAAIFSLADGAFVERITLDAGLPPGMGRPFQIDVAPSVLAGGVELLIDEGNVVAECDETNNTDTWQ